MKGEKKMKNESFEMFSASEIIKPEWVEQPIALTIYSVSLWSIMQSNEKSKDKNHF